MVQRKAAQSVKAKTIPVTKSRKATKTETLSNGYEKSKPKQNAKEKAIEKAELAQPDEVEETQEKMEIEIKKENISTDLDPKKQTKAETSESNNEPESKEKSDPGKSEEKPKLEKAPKTVLASTKSRKRKLPDPKIEQKITAKKVTATKSKTKAKKQKIVLDVPSLKSIPGKVFVVGENDVGQLGLDEDIDSKGRPFLLDLPYSVVDIAAGGMHSVCLTENGEVITFGCNDEGALGRVASEEEERIPKRVDIPEKVVQVSAGDSHSAALAESGQVYLWGNFRNGEGQMGLTPDGSKRIAPLKVLNDKTVVKIASGGDHLACLTNDGIVYTCGCGEQGQLGRINPRSCRDGGRKGLALLLEPAKVDRLLTPVNDVWTESYATFLKTQETGSIYAFGLNNYSQLGFENASSDQQQQMKFFPESLSSFSNQSWQQINGGQHHTLALDNDGIVHSLGRNHYGRLGLGEDCEDKSTPTVVPTLQQEKCNSVSCGNCISFAVTQNGTLYSWGMGSSALGHGDERDIHVPHLIKGDLLNSWEVYKVSGGGQHALILACPKKSSTKKKDA